ncbi:inactive tyrosine-protein kinase transmembrane receptor ROR1-like isoform X3 [Montipora capricornis]|uniref:inactive tyrosine-protein kinase transmembrane receptor ROR1-like isoform X3 n=1 Tax=Montipora capricornis TaxID=246305 RepID=UPI0035F1E62F
MGLISLNSLFLAFSLWIFCVTSLLGFKTKRSLESPSSHFSDHKNFCPDCKAPVFDKPLNNETVSEGGRATFKCYASGNPLPDIMWYKHGKPIRDESGLYIVARRSWGARLRIRDVTLNDAGAYLCVANNSEGTASAEAFLVVNVTLKPSSAETEPTLEAASPVTAQPITKQEFLPPDYKQSNPPGSADDSGKHKEPTTSDLDIPTPPAFSDNGSCVKYNGTVCSKVLRGALVYIHSYEKLENIERKLSTAYDNIRTYKELSRRCRPFVQPLLCHYQFPSCDRSSSKPKKKEICYEECEVLRTKICPKEYKIAESQFLQDVLFPVCSSLPRSNTKEGKNCIKLGVNASVIQKPEKTIVRKAPAFDRPLNNETVSKGGRATFKCYASGNPLPDITWYKHGKPIPDESGLYIVARRSWGARLRIREVTLNDAGAYLCVANNSEGTASAEAFLVVNVTLKPSSAETEPTLEAASPVTAQPITKQEFLPPDYKQSNPPGSADDSGKHKEPTTSDLDIPTPPAFSDNGSCVKYNGTVCSKVLRGALVYIHSYEKLENIERKLSTAYDNIRTYKEISRRCRPFVQPLLCHYQFPSCDRSSSKPKKKEICYEECEVLRTKICPKEYKIAESQFLQDVLFPVCSSLPRSNTKEGKNCIKLGVNDSGIQKPKKPVIRKVSSVTGCYTNTGQDFRGNVSVTEKGYVCQAWNSTKPHFHIISPKDHPEIGGGHNFCRNPGGQKKRPWCFTTDESAEFDYCDIPRCEDTPPVEVVSVLYTVIPCLLFAILFASVVIFVCWRCRKQIMHQAEQTAAIPLVPVVGKPVMKEMRYETVRFVKDLGEGEFGKLYMGEVVEKADGVQVARPIVAKVLRKSSSSSYRDSFLNQAETWSNFSHPNVMAVIGVCYNGPPTCILYECVEYGTLYDYLVENSPAQSPVDEDDDDPGHLTYHEQLSIAIQVAAGMNYLSQHNYIHGDLAARNCMVGPRMIVKITDVALTRSPFSRDYQRSANRPPMPLRWMAPEGVLNYRFTVETDIWSFGVLLWEIFSFGCRPHDGHSDKEVTELIREHILLPCPSDCPNTVFLLMKGCWDILPPSRPRFSTIYTHLCALRSDSNGLVPPVDVSVSGDYFDV